MSHICDLQTPCFLVDIDRVERNVSRMTKICKDLGVTLRSHTKTHKTLKFAELSTSGTKRCITVSTLKEAEFYAGAGYDDITYAYPVTAEKLSRCEALCKQLQQFHFLVGSQHFVDKLEQYALTAKVKWSVFIAVDCGYGREGVRWDDMDTMGPLALNLTQSDNITFQGLYTHDGGSYDSKGPGEIEHKFNEAAHRMTDVSKRLKEKYGITCVTVGLGSTPSCSRPSSDVAGITEFHPGNYVFYDVMQAQIGSCSFDDVACKVATRVVEVRKDRLLIDCGFLGISQDGKTADGFPVVFEGNPSLRIISMSQELGQVISDGTELDLSKYKVGSMLFIYPWHSCATAAMHDVYHVHKGDTLVETITPTRGW